LSTERERRLLRLPGLAGQTLLEAIRDSSQQMRAPCAGRGSCGKCRVRVDAAADASLLDAPTERELEQLSAEEVASGVRLACLARFRQSGEAALELGEEGLAIPLEAYSITVDAEVRAAVVDSGRPLRVAIDLGTTTLVVCLVDALSSKVVSVRAEANAQKSWGADVVSRIQSVRDDPAALAALQKVVVRQLDRLIREQLAACGRAGDELGLIAVAGNTTMLHLLAGADPSGMACLPFRPVFLEARRLPARDCGFRLPESCELLLLPGISPFVGADLTAGILATELYRAERMELLIDIGTNGEIILGSAPRMWATATAAGPAFEGAQITHGCAGVPGALDHAGEGANGFWYTTIMDAPLVGICGSGLLDLIAWLRRSGRMDETGCLELADAEESFRPDPQLPIAIDQRDIRQLQLAKGAIAAGITLLCSRAGITVGEIDRVHLAGGFGSCLRADSALDIGLLPPALRGKVKAVGNTSLKGALLAVSRSTALARCKAIAGCIESVDLAAEPGFQDAFAECMLFPEDLPDV
jgi:uncharacterized 2Fe-2S/4Fe-4S cluster protein (DUF4445 family)